MSTPRDDGMFYVNAAAVSVELQLAYPAVGKFSRASSAGGRRNL